jgi:deoxyribodipyrimidine photo-lyase
MVSVFLFGRDLRLGDHAGLTEAARWGDVLPLLVLDDAAAKRLAANPRRAAYYCAAAASLERELDAKGSRLIFRRVKNAARALPAFAREAGAKAITFSAAYGGAAQSEQRELQSVLEEAGFRATLVHDAPAVSPEDTAAARTDDSGNGYRALSPYLAAWSAQSRRPHARVERFARHELLGDALPRAQDFGALPTPGDDAHDQPHDEARARAALETYLAGPVLHYLAARNVPASAETSRLSAALSFGVISARTVLAALDERRADPFLVTEERLALDAFGRSLAQRDFFLQLAWFFDDAPDRLLQARMRAFRFAKTHPHLDAWLAGCTGFPLVDAGMRELRATGWMHPRVRLIAASFLCFDLGIDWRTGRDAWERHLVEDEPALANGNWQWVAGVGADLAQFPRIYNPRKQQRAIDPQGAYVRRWIPELANVPDADLLAPEDGALRTQLALPLFGASQYPAPVLDHERAARDFLARYAAFVERPLTR